MPGNQDSKTAKRIWKSGPFPRVIKFQKLGSLQWHWAVVEDAYSTLKECPSQEEAERLAGAKFVDMVWDEAKKEWAYEGYEGE